jgi:hypothetical protein
MNPDRARRAQSASRQAASAEIGCAICRPWPSSPTRGVRSPCSNHHRRRAERSVHAGRRLGPSFGDAPSPSSVERSSAVNTIGLTGRPCRIGAFSL